VKLTGSSRTKARRWNYDLTPFQYVGVAEENLCLTVLARKKEKKGGGGAGMVVALSTNRATFLSKIKPGPPPPPPTKKKLPLEEIPLEARTHTAATRKHARTHKAHLEQATLPADTDTYTHTHAHTLCTCKVHAKMSQACSTLTLMLQHSSAWTSI
jgi:hypothetical protein